MSNYTIKQLSEEEYDLLNNIFIIYQASFDSSLKISQNEVRKYFMDGQYIINYILNNGNGDICGFCFLEPLDKINAIQVDYIAIDKRYQGKGLAKLLFEHIYDTYCINGKIMTLECEDRLIEFYKKLGCQLIPVKYNVQCKHHLNIMTKSKNGVHFRDYHKIVNRVAVGNDYSESHYSFKLEFIIRDLLTNLTNITHNSLPDNRNPCKYFNEEGII